MLQDIISLDDEKIFKFICDFAECVSSITERRITSSKLEREGGRERRITLD